MRLVSGAEMREIDWMTIEKRGIPAEKLMGAAGYAVAEAVQEEAEPGPVLILCGKGNNAGDGFVAGRFLVEAGWAVTVALLVGTSALTASAAAEFTRLQKTKARIVEIRSAAELREMLAATEIVIDAMLGTGTQGPPREPFRWAIETLNSSRLPVFAVDVPSGLIDADDTGQPQPGPVVKAGRTITLGLPKLALVCGEGAQFAGHVTVAPIGFPRDLLESPRLWRNMLTQPNVRALLRSRPREGHKGTFGHVIVVGGSAGMGGAVMLAGMGALRSGVGMVHIAAPESVMLPLEIRLPEALKVSLRTGKNADHLDAPGGQKILELAGKLDRLGAVALGPGIGRDERTSAATRYIIEHLEAPLVLDADGINAMLDDPNRSGLLRQRTSRGRVTILTPHPGEFARLTGVALDEVQRRRMNHARTFAEYYGCTVVLKGAGTIIALPDGSTYLNPTGNTGLAKGGSGDVLAGLIGGILAQGYDQGEAARIGVFLHGMAADIAIENSNPRAILPTDVADALGAAWRRLEKSK